MLKHKIIRIVFYTLMVIFFLGYAAGLYYIIMRKGDTGKLELIKASDDIAMIIPYIRDDNNLFMITVDIPSSGKHYCAIDTGSGMLIVYDPDYDFDKNVPFSKKVYGSQTHNAQFLVRNFKLNGYGIKNDRPIKAMIDFTNVHIGFSKEVTGSSSYNLLGLSPKLDTRIYRESDTKININTGLPYEYFSIMNKDQSSNSGFLCFFNKKDSVSKIFLQNNKFKDVRLLKGGDNGLGVTRNYGSSYFIVDMKLRFSDKEYNIPCIIDTGSNWTSIPESILNSFTDRSKIEFVLRKTNGEDLIFSFTNNYINSNYIDRIPPDGHLSKNSYMIWGSFFMNNLTMVFGEENISFAKTDEIINDLSNFGKFGDQTIQLWNKFGNAMSNL